MSDIKYIDIKEFREQGYLQELNRKFLHPLGLALEVRVDENGKETLGRVWDYRDDPEGMNFGDGIDVHKALAIEHLWHAKAVTRLKTLGYVVQPKGTIPIGEI